MDECCGSAGRVNRVGCLLTEFINKISDHYRRALLSEFLSAGFAETITATSDYCHFSI
jgi:hypothetical protein